MNRRPGPERSISLSERGERLAIFPDFDIGLPMVRNLIALLFVGSLLFGCGREEAEGRTKKTPSVRGPERSEERAIGKFSALSVPGKVQVIVRRGETTSAKLRGPDNYLKDITLKMEKREIGGKSVDVLVVGLTGRVKFPPPEVEVSTPELTFVEALGAARVKLDDFSSSRLKVVARKAAKVELGAGAYGEMEAEAHFAARILGPQVMVETARLSALGGPAVISVGQVARLARQTAGGGRVVYQGQPEFIK